MRALLWIGGGLLLLVTMVAWLVTVPTVQSYLVRQASGWLEDRLGVPVELQRVDVALPHHAVLGGLDICDQRGQTLLRVKELRVGLLSFSLWTYLFDQDEVQTLRLSDLRLIGPEVNLYRPPQGPLNLQFLLDALRGDSSPDGGGRLPFNLVVDRMYLREGQLRYRDSTRWPAEQAPPGLMDYANLAVEDLALDARFALDTAGLAQLALRHLSLHETQADWTLDSLRLRLVADTLDASGLRSTLVRGLTLRADSTHLQADLAFVAQPLSELLAFDERFRYRADFAPGNRVDFHTLSVLVGDSLPLTGVPSLSGVVTGDLNALTGTQLRIGYRRDTRLRTNLRMVNLQKARDTRLDVRFANSTVSMPELRQMLAEVGLPELLETLGVLTLDGSFVGGYYDFNTALSTETEQGSLSADLHLVIPPVSQLVTYQGRVFTQGLNLNAFGLSEQPLSRNLNFQGQLDGQGVSLDEADLTLDARILRSDLGGYRVDSLRAAVEIHQRQVAGLLFAEDGVGQANLAVDFDLNQQPATYQADGSLTRVDLRRYGLVADSALMSTRLHVDLRGDSLDGLRGETSLAGTYFSRPSRRRFHLPDLDLRIADLPLSQGKYLSVHSQALTLDLAGDFTFARLADFVRRQVQETRLYLSNDSSAIRRYYAEKQPDSTGLDLTVAITPRDSLGKLLSYFDLPAHFSPGLRLRANLTYQPPQPTGFVGSDAISLTIEDTLPGPDRDSLAMAGLAATGLHFDVDFFKRGDTSDLVLNAGLTSRAVYPTEGLALQDLDLYFFGAGGRFEAEMFLAQSDAQSQAELFAEFSFDPDGSIRTYLKTNSYLKVPQDSLSFTQQGDIVFTGDSILIQSLRLANQHATRALAVQGVLSSNPQDSLRVEIDSLDLETFNDLLGLSYRLAGRYDADLNVRAALGQARIDLDSRLSGLRIDGYPYGDIAIRSAYLTQQHALDLYADVIHEGDTNIVLAGRYFFDRRASPLALNLRTKRGFPLGYLTPFVEGQLADLDGRVGLEKFSITGALDSPLIAGRGRFEETGFTVDYFRTQYQLDGQLRFDNDRITLQDMRLTDPRDPSRRASLRGNVLHRNFQEFSLNLQLESVRNFLVMDTRKEHNELFYGRLILQNALADLQGDLENIELQAVASFAPNSVLRLPLTDESEYGRPDFIVFADDPAQAAADLNTGLTGFDLNLTALLTENLEVELIFDERVGDIIRGRGEGNVTMKIDESGAFSMFGRYEVQQGDYLFTSQNVINKKFEVVPGGSIVWTGDPYDAQIDIQARYPVMADIQDIVGAEQPIRVPTNVLMRLQGSLEQPEISLSIEINNLSESYASEVASYVRSIQFDEQELNKQVFSLMVFNRFAPAGLTSQLASTGVTTSISEMLSNQFNYWLSGITNDKVNVNVNASNFQDVNLLISARLFNDRVTIERDGGIPGANTPEASGGNGGSQDQLSSLIGNISLIIRLLPNPSKDNNQVRPSELVLEVFNRNTVTQTANGTNASTQTGLGLFYKKDFDRLQEIFRRKRQAREVEEAAQPDEEEAPTDSLPTKE